MQRVQLTPGYVLHSRPYRDSGRMLDVWTREHGRLTLFARGVRGGKSRSASNLQPFRLLLLSFAGRDDTAQLTAVEPAPGAAVTLPAASLLPAWYLNELIIKLSLRRDPQPTLFDNYAAALTELATAEEPSLALRRFELALLATLGFGIDFRCSRPVDEPLRADGFYRFDPVVGFARSTDSTDLAGADLLALAREDWSDAGARQVANKVLRVAVAQCLEGRELHTRRVARSVYERTRL